MIINSNTYLNEISKPALNQNNLITPAIENNDNSAATIMQQVKVTTDKPNQKQVQEAVEQIQQFTQTMVHNLKFSIDDDTGKTVVKIVDSQTDELIRQIPSEEAINIARALGKVHGTLFNVNA